MGKRYTYICGKGHEFEVTRRMSEIKNMKCSEPWCRNTDFKRKYTTPFVMFKGKGFYTTDNKK